MNDVSSVTDELQPVVQTITLGNKQIAPRTYVEAVKTQSGEPLSEILETSKYTTTDMVNKRNDDIVNWSPEKMIKEMGAGWNLNNTLESYHKSYTTDDPSYWETLWGNPVTTLKMIQEVRKAGFNTVRIPVTWFNNLNSDSTVKTAWMDRVEEVVNYVLDSNMFCILNVHHDTGYDGVLTAEFSRVWEMMYNLEHLWEQIATRFSKYNYRLMFEGFNEIVNPTLADYWGGDADSYKAVNMLNQAFVNTVRKIPGNESRFLLCAPYAAQFQEGPISAFELPSDNVEGKILARLNIYHKNKHHVLKTLYTIERYFSFNNIPCVITELGIEDLDNVLTDAERAELTSYQVKYLRKMGIGSLMWDGKYNRTNYTWGNPQEVGAFIGFHNRVKTEIIRLDSSYDLKDINNFRSGEYSFNNGLYYETDEKISLSTYVTPVYDWYVVTTTVEGLTYLIAQLDENFNMVEVAIRGNYGSFKVNSRTRLLGITLYKDGTPYTLDEFETLLQTNTFTIVPHDEAVKFDPTDVYCKKSEIADLIAAQLDIPSITTAVINQMSSKFAINKITTLEHVETSFSLGGYGNTEVYVDLTSYNFVNPPFVIVTKFDMGTKATVSSVTTDHAMIKIFNESGQAIGAEDDEDLTLWLVLIEPTTV